MERRRTKLGANTYAAADATTDADAATGGGGGGGALPSASVVGLWQRGTLSTV